MINLTLRDIYGYDYEVLGNGAKPLSSCGSRYNAHDFYYTRQFIARLQVSPSAWRGLLRQLNRTIAADLSERSEVYEAVTRLCLSGELVFYKLPRIESLRPLSSGEGWGICLVKGPNPHCTSGLAPVTISSLEEAAALLDSVSATESQLVSHIHVNQLTHSFSFNGAIKDTVVSRLAKGELLAYKVKAYSNKAAKKNVEYMPATGPGYDKVPLAPETKAAPPPVVPALEAAVIVKPLPATATLAQRRGVAPVSMDDAVNRLNSMKEQIKLNKGHIPKYTDAELLQQAALGDVAKERFHVRFMEVGYLQDRSGGGEGSGLLGQAMEGTTGNGAKYWSTTFDQLEDADSDPRLIAEKLGLDYDPKAKYALIIIDTHAAAPITGVASVPATFEKVSEFANRELPDEFPKEFTDKVMNTEYQKSYAAHHQAGIDAEFLKDEWSRDIKAFKQYLASTDMDESDQAIMLQRMEMQARIGNNQHYLGNGLTKNNIDGSPNQYGIVETINFERKPVTLNELEKNNALQYVFKETV